MQLSSTQSLVGHIAGQRYTTYNGLKTQRNDLSSTQESHAAFWDAVVQHSWTKSPRVLNQFTFHRKYMNGIFDYTGAKTETGRTPAISSTRTIRT